VPIEEIQGCASPRIWLKEYVFGSKPVVFRGCFRSEAMERWNDEYLVTKGQNWTESSNVRFTDYVQFYRKIQGRGAEYFSLDTMPDGLREDIRLPKMLQCTELVTMLENVVMWLSMGGQRSDLHYDQGDFLLAQIDGQKHFLMADPADSRYLYSDFPRHHKRVGMAGLNAKRVDLKMFPKASEITLYEATLNPGDMIFIPSMWWHLVSSLPWAHAKEYKRNLAITIQTIITLRNTNSNYFLSHDIKEYIEKTRKNAAHRARKMCKGLEDPSAFMERATLKDMFLQTPDRHILKQLLQNSKELRSDPLQYYHGLTEEIIANGGASLLRQSPGATAVCVSDLATVETGKRKQCWVLVSGTDVRSFLMEDTDLNIFENEGELTEIIFPSEKAFMKILSIESDAINRKVSQWTRNSEVLVLMDKIVYPPLKSIREEKIRRLVKPVRYRMFERLYFFLQRVARFGMSSDSNPKVGFIGDTQTSLRDQER